MDSEEADTTYPSVINEEVVKSWETPVTPSNFRSIQGGRKPSSSASSRPIIERASQSEPVPKTRKNRKGSSSCSTTPDSPTPGDRRKGKSRSVSDEVFVPPNERYLELEEPPAYFNADHAHHKVVKYLNKPLAKEDELGHVYILQDPERPEYIKVGSAQCPPERISNIKKECKFRELTSCYVSKPLPEAWAMKIEELVHFELGYFRRRFLCGACRKRHREFFEIGSHIAERIIERWISIPADEIYDEDRVLRKRWRDKVNQSTVKNRVVQDHNDHDGRHLWWTNLRAELDEPVGVEAEGAPNEDLQPTDHARPGRAISDREPTGHEWPLWCIFQALLLFLSSANWPLRYFIYAPNLVGTIAVWILVHLDAFARVRQRVVDLWLFKGQDSAIGQAVSSASMPL